MDKTKKIDVLIEKYFEGQTSLSEEDILRKYFGQGKIAVRHSKYAPLFEYFIGERDDVAIVKKKRQGKISLLYLAGAVACALIMVMAGIRFALPGNKYRSVMYINGELVSDQKAIGEYALISIDNISNIDDETIETQISILDVFTEQE